MAWLQGHSRLRQAPLIVDPSNHIETIFRTVAILIFGVIAIVAWRAWRGAWIPDPLGWLRGG
jgi:hypothetical protein